MKSERLEFSCLCGQPMVLAWPLATHEVKCTKCGRVLVIEWDAEHREKLQDKGLSQFLEMGSSWDTQSWSVTNRQRGQLIDKDIAGTITAEERVRLDVLQAYADYHLQKISRKAGR